MLARRLFSLFVVLALSTVALAQRPGAAFVVDRYSFHVDGNNFERLDSVFLTGGPGPTCSGPGLVDGDYYFQITDPAGTLLLSNDPVAERRVRVSGGYFAQYLGSKHLASLKGPCGALFVRLYPFLVSPYPLREYKVWLTRVEDYDPLLSNLFGFDPALCHSDNFRVLAPGPQSIVQGFKFFDHDHSGTWNPQADPFEVPIGGWRVELRRNGVLDGVTFTDQNGRYTFIRDRDGSTYEVREISPNGFVNDGTPGATWLATTARSGNVATTGEYVPAAWFGNISYELSVGVGRPRSFWCDRDVGGPVLAACEPQWRTALNTRHGAPVNLRNPVSNDNPNASIFTLNLPPQSFNGAFANFKSFCNKQSHDHAGFLLSREVAAAILNNTCGFMQGDIYIDRFQDGVLVSLDDMLAGAIGLLSQTGAGLTGPNDPFQALRAMMIGCTNEFGRINETGDPSAPQVVYRATEFPSRVQTPY
ncbi:MAG: hypothetical protein JNL28_10910 [Planctomycetes bacterium]|nr:hypothetical protein [Planctomycetota bacterium]